MHNKLTIHRSTATIARTETHEGREHLVAPVIAVKEGVLNGELALSEEFGKYPDSWNGIPLPINHPTEKGVPVSANSPSRIEEYSVGRFFNAHLDGDALKGEIWVDVEKATELGGEALEVVNRLQEGKPIEVSTAYFNDIEDGSGTFNSKEYNGIQRNMRPDHLALLPNDIGACSWEDGCGVRANNERSENKGMFEKMSQKFKHFMANMMTANQDEVSHNEISELLESAMTRDKGDAMRFMIRERFNDHFIYQEATNNGFDGRMFKRNYQIDENNNVTLGSEEEVRRVVSYEPTGNSEEEDLAGEGETENQVQEPSGTGPEEHVENTDTEHEGENEVKTNCECNQKQTGNEEHESPAVNKDTQPKTMDQWLQEIPDEETRNFIINSQKKQKEHREKLVNSLSTNERCAFDKEDLQEMSTNALEKLDKSLQVNDYSGAGGPRSSYSQNSAEDEVPQPPSILFANKKEDK
ncbi:DUF2213 domain-containing protein [Desertibacillus haloalkaliphilus]|uniref:DUF2213 domain-containing protein n=1 Tax=Desertibacillus haloalkaliphilus TaxID=1328930 RepID=UPI001C2788EA|nr:DUF2213 domain-containing protein [Desertibacillus haloalkaliphilus]MBU8908514.1 DUF2213 domain-containing protein [Desertibacillus haloalkaliphilus]